MRGRDGDVHSVAHASRLCFVFGGPSEASVRPPNGFVPTRSLRSGSVMKHRRDACATNINMGTVTRTVHQSEFGEC